MHYTEAENVVKKLTIREIAKLAGKSRRYIGAPHGEPGGIDVDFCVAHAAVCYLIHHHPRYTPSHRLADDKLAARKPGRIANRNPLFAVPQ